MQSFINVGYTVLEYFSGIAFLRKTEDDGKIITIENGIKTISHRHFVVGNLNIISNLSTGPEVHVPFKSWFFFIGACK